jgi:hypothetical protein
VTFESAVALYFLVAGRFLPLERSKIGTKRLHTSTISMLKVRHNTSLDALKKIAALRTA